MYTTWRFLFSVLTAVNAAELRAAGPMTLEQNIQYAHTFKTAFPDSRFDFTGTLVDGDYVVDQWVANGTQTGPLHTPTGGTIPATGKQARVAGVLVSEIRNGKLTHAWQYFDMVSILAQLGVMPAM